MADPSWQLALARYRIPRRLATRARQSSFQVASAASILIVTLASGHSRKITEREWARSLPLLDRTKEHSADAWHWVVLRYDGKSMTSFVDGVQELQGAVEFAPMAAGKTSVGVRQNKLYWFKGAIREVRFTPAALPADQLQKLQ